MIIFHEQKACYQLKGAEKGDYSGRTNCSSTINYFYFNSS